MGILQLSIALFCLIFIQIEATETDANRICPNDSLPCNDGECVSRGKWCDEEKNCQDESDEAYCTNKGWWNKNPNNCGDAHFKCEIGHCIPLVGRCDGFEDCKDKSDEWNCEPETYDDYDDYVLSKSTTIASIETTTTESSFKSDEIEDDDIATATQSSHLVVTQGAALLSSTRGFYANRIEHESMQTDIPRPIKLSTPTPKALPVTDPITSQLTVKNTTSSKSLPSTTHPSTTYRSRWSSSNSIVTSTRPTFEPRRQSTEPLTTSSTQPSRPYQVGHRSPIRSSTSNYYLRRTSDAPDERKSYQPLTQSPSYSEDRRPPLLQSQARSTPVRDTRRESYHYSTQPSISSSSRHINQNQPVSSFPKTRTDAYHRQTQPIRPQESSRAIPGNHQQYRPTSYSTLEQPYDARQSRQQPYDAGQSRQQPHDARQSRQQPTDARQSRQQPYDTRQQSYDTRHQPYDNRQLPYDSRRNADQYQSQVSGSNSYLGHPTGQVRSSQYPHHGTFTGATINGFQIYGIYSSDGNRLYDGYYNQDGQFVTVNPNQEPYTQYITVPPRRTQPQPLTISTSAPVFHDGKLKVPSRFYFANNYSRIYSRENAEFIEKGRDWILSTRDSEGGWGKETPRALIALSLINNSFVNETYENNIMQKYFQVFLGTSLIRGDTETTSVSRLAMSVNALIATCHNPRDFHGTDYTELLRRKLREQLREDQDRRNRDQRVNPFVYLSLCLADRNLERHELHDLMTRLQSHDSPDEFEQDKQTMAISAFTCHLQRKKAIDSSPSEYQRSLDFLLSNATSKLLKRMRDDGSFGSVYSTAVAAQALMSVNDTIDWNPKLTLNFLKENQKDDGSFGDFLATYLALPALGGRSLLHLRNTQCTPPNIERALTPTEILEFRGPKHHVKYSLLIGNPKTNGYSIEVLVPVGISFFDIMRVAAHKNDAFKFSYEERGSAIHVYSISNVPNDSERGLEWSLFATSRSNLIVDKPESLDHIRRNIKEFYPRTDQHVIFWYKPSDKWT